MRLLINHLTRMQPGLICTAGLDSVTGLAIRPLAAQSLTTELLEQNGGPLALGKWVDFGDTEFCGQVPEIEDRRFQLENLCAVERASPLELYERCAATAVEQLRDIFGPELEWIIRDPDLPGTAAIPQFGGIRSLGCYWARGASLAVITDVERKKVRLRFVEGPLAFSVAVTDIRLYQADHVTPDLAAMEKFESQIQGCDRLLVAVGLSRARRFTDNTPARHWLQINNLYPPKG